MVHSTQIFETSPIPDGVQGKQGPTSYLVAPLPVKNEWFVFIFFSLPLSASIANSSSLYPSFSTTGIGSLLPVSAPSPSRASPKFWAKPTATSRHSKLNTTRPKSTLGSTSMLERRPSPMVC